MDRDMLDSDMIIEDASGGLTKSAILKREIISWIKVVVFAILAAYLINNFVLVNAAVPTGSMEGTIMPGDRIVALRLSYIFSEPDRFDIIVHKFPDDGETLFIKRIIGLPGDIVEIIDGQVFLNGSYEPLEEPFVQGVPHGNFGPITVPEYSYFVMGDNRNHSSDSREWINRYVHRNQILGRALFGYFPRPKLLR